MSPGPPPTAPSTRRPGPPYNDYAVRWRTAPAIWLGRPGPVLGDPGRHTIDPAWRRRTIQREIEDHLSEKIPFGELKAGQIVTVDVEGTRPEAQFTFQGVPKPGEMPDTPPAEIASESKAAAGRTGGQTDQRRVTPPGSG
jgi:hypothetical protein